MRVTAVDASPEVIAINRGRVAVDNVRYVQADLFAFEPQARYDCVFMSFWLSHVPHARFAAFWSMVGDALAPGGFAYRAVAFVELPHHAVGALDDPIKSLRAHLLSIGVRGDVAPSSFAWFTPSARAM